MAILPSIIGVCYRLALKPVLFRFDPEDVHEAFASIGSTLRKSRFLRLATSFAFRYRDPSLASVVDGVRYENPVGLAAGFDKDAHLVDILPDVGFGFEEIGSVTALPCAGNPKPRLWRLPKSRSLIVYYGLKNDGAAVVRARLHGRKFRFPVGASIAMTNCAANADCSTGIGDYAEAFASFVDIADYLTVNVSCPNAFGGQPFTDPKRLELLLARLDGIANDKPVYLKLSPDLSRADLDAVVAVAAVHRVRGFICSNLTKSRDNAAILDRVPTEKGGLSGKVVAALAGDQLGYLYSTCGGRFTIIACGGIFTDEDAYALIRRGASLVQLVTGMIFEGPQIIGEINRGLAKRLKADGFKSISEAVGADV